MNQAPTIGRRVYYWPSEQERSAMASNDPKMPFDAGVVYVWGPTCVNLDVTDHAGMHWSKSSVAFGAPFSEGGPYADWMPYQKGASHTEPPQTKLLGEQAADASQHPYPRFGDRA